MAASETSVKLRPASSPQFPTDLARVNFANDDRQSTRLPRGLTAGWAGVALRSLAGWLGVATALMASAKAPVLKSEANVMAEVTFTARRAYPDPFNQVTLDAVFTDPTGRKLVVPAFWAGTNLWKARYASAILGTHRYRTVCSEKQDSGLHAVTGAITITPYRGTNRLYTRGPLQVAPDHRHLQYRDGTPFFWLGDTWWMGLSQRLQWPGEFQRLTADRAAKGFTVIQFTAAFLPNMPAFDRREANEAGFAWETNFTRIRPEYFDAADARVRHLADQGLVPCLVGAWGYCLPWLGLEKVKQHWRYLIARYAALPVVWCAAGEGTLPYYLDPNFPENDFVQGRGWTEVMAYIRATDPFHRLVTVHPAGKGRASARTVTGTNTAVLDIDMLQLPHWRREGVPETVTTVRQSYADQPVLPVLAGEAAYEMAEMGNFTVTTEWTRQYFWLCMLNGAAGHTYGANGIWQLNRPGQPFGPGPRGDDNGNLPWDEAMHLPGSTQVSLGKALLEQYPWPRLVPHPECVRFAVRRTEPPNDGVYAPQAAEIPGVARFIYVPEPAAIVVSDLGRQVWPAFWFDPVTGRKTTLPAARAGDDGQWHCPPPAGHDHDWVIVLEGKGAR